MEQCMIALSKANEVRFANADLVKLIRESGTDRGRNVVASVLENLSRGRSGGRYAYSSPAAGDPEVRRETWRTVFAGGRVVHGGSSVRELSDRQRAKLAARFVPASGSAWVRRWRFATQIASFRSDDGPRDRRGAYARPASGPCTVLRDALKDKSYQEFPIGQDAAAYLRAKRKRLTESSYRDYEGCLDKLAEFSRTSSSRRSSRL